MDLTEMKRQALEAEKRALVEEYEALNRQLAGALGAGEALKLRRQMKEVEERVAEVERELGEGSGEPPAARRICMVPYPRNPFFTGRETVLEALHNALTSGQTAALTQPQVISGLGGIGKTQTAVEYAYQHQAAYEAVLWARAETEVVLVEGFVEIARELGLPEAAEAEVGRAVTAAKRWLASREGWLLILDNADDLGVVRPVLPNPPGGHVLLTTRAAAVGTAGAPVELGILPAEVGALFLLRRSRRLGPEAALEAAAPEDREAALALSRELGGLPLALEQAAAFIEETPSSPAEYRRLYRERGKRLRAWKGRLGPVEHAPVTTTFSLAFENVAARSQAAADLLRLCAFLAPEAIPEELFTQGGVELGEALGAVAADPLGWLETVEAAGRYSLLGRDVERRSLTVRPDVERHTLTVHRVVQAVLRDGMGAETRRLWASRAVRSLEGTLPAIEFGNWPAYDRLLPHLLAVAEWIESEAIASGEAARLLNQAGYYLSQRARFGAAEPLLQGAVALYERVKGPTDAATATSLNNLAVLYSEQGRYREAEPLLERSLEALEQALGPDHPDVAAACTSLASLYNDMGRYGKAESLLNRALKIREKAFGPDHPMTAKSLRDLGGIYRAQGRYPEAKRLYERALTIREGALGPEHPDTAVSLSNLGELYLTLGQHDKAEPLLRRALDIDERVYGPDHPEVASDLINLAEVHSARKEHDRSEALLERALAIRESAFGPEHPAVAACLNNLGGECYRRGRYGKAEPYLRRAVAIHEQTLGPDHPDTKRARANYDALKKKMYRRIG
jgi:tetratricopeptide (TPR) repeat protein